MMANKFDKDERETVRDNLNQEWQCYIHEFSYQNLDATISTKHHVSTFINTSEWLP